MAQRPYMDQQFAPERYCPLSRETHPAVAKVVRLPL